MENLSRIIGEHVFFHGLPTQYLDLLAGCAKNARFEKGAALLREGEEADWFYLIREGRASIETSVPGRPAVTFETVGEGDILGWSWLVPPYRWRFDATALEPVRAFALDGACLRAKCEQDHDLGYELLKRISMIMAHRLQATRVHALDVYSAWFDASEGVAVR